MLKLYYTTIIVYRVWGREIFEKEMWWLSREGGYGVLAAHAAALVFFCVSIILHLCVYSSICSSTAFSMSPSRTTLSSHYGEEQYTWNSYSSPTKGRKKLENANMRKNKKKLLESLAPAPVVCASSQRGPFVLRLE